MRSRERLSVEVKIEYVKEKREIEGKREKREQFILGAGLTRCLGKKVAKYFRPAHKTLHDSGSDVKHE